MFITFEGIDGSGKSTVAKLVVDKLLNNNIDSILTREPGGDPISEQIRSFILDINNDGILLWTEVLLYLSSRTQHVEHIIKPNLEKGKVIICDRFMDSTTVYQGFGRGLDVDKIEKLQEIILGETIPNLTFFFDISPKDVMERIQKRGKLDRLESESTLFLEKVYKGYQYLIDRYSNRFVVINANRTPEEIADEIYNKILKELSCNKKN